MRSIAFLAFHQLCTRDLKFKGCWNSFALIKRLQVVLSFLLECHASNLLHINRLEWCLIVLLLFWSEELFVILYLSLRG